ncbi:MAG: protein phosphatase 2C domain-containing protein [Microcoleaceae cyanobacterium]
MPKRYLWAIGDEVQTLSPGTLIADRYLIRGSQILLDTHPEQRPELPDEIPDVIIPYLRLFPERLHVPQIYGMISPKASRLHRTIWLLEQAPIHPLQEVLTPQLTEAWINATPIRQLNWLWQIAQLWSACQRQQVASSLLNPDLLYISGPVVQLLELQLDSKPAKLSQLGKLWQQWITTAHPSLQTFLKQLTHQLIHGHIRAPEPLINQLDQALFTVGRSLVSRKITITTATDKGPTRAQNEDACYPEVETVVEIPANTPGLAVVCDGIGGQEGGEIAARIAINTLFERMQPSNLRLSNGDPNGMISQLHRSVNSANDQISNRNDQERRQGRERMGTTVVMGLAHHHELYLTHVGDSRAYWITYNNCYQITLDDDVASREVRLGYALYQDALQQRASGALIQALGITNSANLHPTIARFPIDEDCVILLCSDGLSDKDRVESYWKQEIWPILTGETDVVTVRDRLIEIANTRNGHDNVTVALMHFQVYPHPELNDPNFELSVPPVPEIKGDNWDDDDDSSGIDEPKTEIFVPLPRSKRKVRQLSVGIILLLAIAGSLFYLLKLFNSSTLPDDETTQPPPPDQPLVEVEEPPKSLSLELSSLIQVGNQSVAVESVQTQPIQIFQEFGQPLIQGNLPPGSVIQILGKQSTPQAGKWLEVKICSVPPSAELEKETDKFAQTNLDLSELDSEEAALLDSSLTDETAINLGKDLDELASVSPQIATLSPGNLGWIREQDLIARIIPTVIIRPEQIGVCQPENYSTINEPD